MAPRKDPASVVVDFFTNADVNTAATVLAICKGIVAKRQPAKVKGNNRKTQRPVVEMALEPKS